MPTPGFPAVNVMNGPLNGDYYWANDKMSAEEFQSNEEYLRNNRPDKHTSFNQTLSTQTNLLNSSTKLKIQKQKSRRRWRSCTLNRLCNLSPFIVSALFFIFFFSYFFKLRKFLTFYSSLKSIKPSYTKLNHLKLF